MANRARSDKAYDASIKGRFRRLRSAVKKNGHRFNLTFSNYERLIKSPCTYCGSKIDRFPSSYWTDRADSTKGYIRSNVVPCCPICNYFKGELLTKEEAIYVIRYIKRIAPSVFTGARGLSIKRIKARRKRKV